MNFKKVKKFFTTIFHGLKGSAIFFMLSIMFFALWKIIYIMLNRDLLLSKYLIGVVMAAFIILGFIYGVLAYRRKTYHHKMYSVTKKNFIINLLLTILFTGYFWYVLRNKIVPSNTLYVFAIVTFILFYAFSALISNIHHHISKRQHKKIKKSTIFFAIIFNPIFVLIYLWLFSMVVYNSAYVPCGVSVIGVDNNVYTSNTRNLGITPDERIIAIDGAQIRSLQDVRDYMNSLDVTKEVNVETTNHTYLVRTYQVDGKRYMGLLLKEEVCAREY
jgi:cytochrome bd-type quinol oxidase subunit 2